MIAIGALLLSSCSDEGDGKAAPEPSGPTSADISVIQPGKPGEEASTGAPEALPSAKWNQADVAFMQMMIPHHGQALTMSKLAAKYAQDGQVRKIAARIQASQAPEIITMSSWLQDRDLDVPKAADELNHGDHGSDEMMGMLTKAQLDALSKARGAKFDRLFLRGMIGHHRGAIDMADTVAQEGTDILVSELAADVNASQSAEIARMEDMLES